MYSHALISLSPSGLIREASESLFTYLPYESLGNFSSPNYQPLLDLDLTNHSVLVERCQGDTFCLFDYMVTGSDTFAQLTLETVMEVNRTQEIVSQGPGEYKDTGLLGKK